MIGNVHAAGPFSHRALLTLAEKHVPYKEEYIDFDNKPKWYAAEQDNLPVSKYPLCCSRTLQC